VQERPGALLARFEDPFGHPFFLMEPAAALREHSSR
jgi:hypothetical protein